MTNWIHWSKTADVKKDQKAVRTRPTRYNMDGEYTAFNAKKDTMDADLLKYFNVSIMPEDMEIIPIIVQALASGVSVDKLAKEHRVNRGEIIRLMEDSGLDPPGIVLKTRDKAFGTEIIEYFYEADLKYGDVFKDGAFFKVSKDWRWVTCKGVNLFPYAPLNHTDYIWDSGGADNDWSTLDNWDVAGTVPDDNNDTAKLDATADTITTSAAITIGELTSAVGFTGDLDLGDDFTVDDAGSENGAVTWAVGDFLPGTNSMTIDWLATISGGTFGEDASWTCNAYYIISTGGTFEAPDGSGSFTILYRLYMNGGTFAHNDGKLITAPTAVTAAIDGNDTTFYDIQKAGGIYYLDLNMNATIEHELSWVSGYDIRTYAKTYTFGSWSASGYIKGGHAFAPSNAGDIYITGADASFPAIIDTSDLNWDRVSGATIHLALTDVQVDITSGGGGITIEIDDDVTIDGVIITANDTFKCTTGSTVITGNPGKAVTVFGTIEMTGGAGNEVEFYDTDVVNLSTNSIIDIEYFKSTCGDTNNGLGLQLSGSGQTYTQMENCTFTSSGGDYGAVWISTTTTPTFTSCTFDSQRGGTGYLQYDIIMANGGSAQLDQCTITHGVSINSGSAWIIAKDATPDFTVYGPLTSTTPDAGWQTADITGDLTLADYYDSNGAYTATSYTLGAAMANADEISIPVDTGFDAATYALTAEGLYLHGGTFDGGNAANEFEYFHAGTVTSDATLTSDTMTLTGGAGAGEGIASGYQFIFNQTTMTWDHNNGNIVSLDTALGAGVLWAPSDGLPLNTVTFNHPTHSITLGGNPDDMTVEGLWTHTAGTFDMGDGVMDMHDIFMSAGTLDMDSIDPTSVFNSLKSASGSATLNLPSDTLTVDGESSVGYCLEVGSGTVNNNGGHVIITTPTASHLYPGASAGVPSNKFYDLTINHAGAAIDIAGATNAHVYVEHDLNITQGQLTDWTNPDTRLTVVEDCVVAGTLNFYDASLSRYLTLGALINTGTVVFDSEDVVITSKEATGGYAFDNDGTITYNSCLVKLTYGGGTAYIDFYSATGESPYDVEFDGAGGTVYVQGGFLPTHDLTVTAGTWDSYGYGHTVAHDIIVDGGTLQANNGYVRATNDLIVNSGTAQCIDAAGRFEITGHADVTGTLDMSINGQTNYFKSMTVNAGGSTTGPTGTLQIKGESDAGYCWYIDAAGAYVHNDGLTLIDGTSLTSDALLNSGGDAFYNLQISNASYYILASVNGISAGNDLTVSGALAATATETLPLTVTGNCSITARQIGHVTNTYRFGATSFKSLTLTGGNYLQPTSQNTTITGETAGGFAIDNDAIWTNNGGTTIITTSTATKADLTGTSGNLYNLTINHATADVEITSGSTVFDGALAVTNGDLKTNAGYSVNITGTTTVANGGKIDLSAADWTLNDNVTINTGGEISSASAGGGSITMANTKAIDNNGTLSIDGDGSDFTISWGGSNTSNILQGQGTFSFSECILEDGYYVLVETNSDHTYNQCHNMMNRGVYVNQYPTAWSLSDVSFGGSTYGVLVNTGGVWSSPWDFGTNVRFNEDENGSTSSHGSQDVYLVGAGDVVINMTTVTWSPTNSDPDVKQTVGSMGLIVDGVNGTATRMDYFGSVDVDEATTDPADGDSIILWDVNTGSTVVNADENEQVTDLTVKTDTTFGVSANEFDLTGTLDGDGTVGTSGTGILDLNAGTADFEQTLTITSGSKVTDGQTVSLIGIDVQSGGELDIDATTATGQGTALTWTFDDDASSGFGASAGTLTTKGDALHFVYFASAGGDAPTNYWGYTCAIDVTADYTEFRAYDTARFAGTIDIDQCDFYYSKTTGGNSGVWIEGGTTVTSFTYNDINHAENGMTFTKSQSGLDHITIQDCSGCDIQVSDGLTVEMTYSSWDPENICLGDGAVLIGDAGTPGEYIIVIPDGGDITVSSYTELPDNEDTVLVYLEDGGTAATVNFDLTRTYGDFWADDGVSVDYETNNTTIEGDLEADIINVNGSVVLTVDATTATGAGEDLDVFMRSKSTAAITIASGATMALLGDATYRVFMQEEGRLSRSGHTVTDAGPSQGIDISAGTFTCTFAHVFHMNNLVKSSTLNLTDSEYWFSVTTSPEEQVVAATWTLSHSLVSCYSPSINQWYIKPTGTITTTRSLFHGLLPTIYSSDYYIVFYHMPAVLNHKEPPKIIAESAFHGSFGEDGEVTGHLSRSVDIQGRVTYDNLTLWNHPLNHMAFMADMHELLADEDEIVKWTWRNGHYAKATLDEFKPEERAGENSVTATIHYTAHIKERPYS